MSKDNSNYRAVIKDADDAIGGIICIIVRVDDEQTITVCTVERFKNNEKDETIDAWIIEQMKTKPWETRQ